MIGKLKFVFLCGCVGYCTLQYLGGFVVCSGKSMEPTIYEFDVLLAEKLSVHKQSIARGDIVIATSPVNPRQLICKRVAAVEGDRIKSSFRYVPRGSVWLEGDNKSDSLDSREYGPVPYGLIQARAFYKILPFSDKGYLSSKDNR